MKYYTKKLITMMLALMLAFVMITPATTQAATQKYTISVKKKTVKKKKTVSIKSTTRLRVKDGKKTVKPAKVKFKSSNKKVATISKKGVIKAKKVGKTTISIRYKNKTAKIKLFVIKPVKSVTLNKRSLSLNKGETKKLKATVSPSNATNKRVTWSSSDKNVATVSKDGTITGKGTGSTTITATSNQGKKKDECDVTISDGKSGSSTSDANDEQPWTDQAVTEEDVVVDGTTFHVKASHLLDVGEKHPIYTNMCVDSNIEITTDKEIDAEKILLTINNGDSEFYGDDTNYQQLQKSTKGYEKYCSWSVPSLYDRACDVGLRVTKNKIKIVFCQKCRKISFPISVYYDNKLIKTFTVKTIAVDNEEIAKVARYRQIQNAAWKPGMGVVEKITAIEEYCEKHFSYEAPDYFDCKRGADILLYTARDLGLEAWETYTYIIDPTGLGLPAKREDGTLTVDYYGNHYGVSSFPGHTAIAYKYNNQIYHTATQGHQ